MSSATEVQPKPWRLVLVGVVVVAALVSGVSWLFDRKPTKQAAAPQSVASETPTSSEQLVGPDLAQIDSDLAKLSDDDFADKQLDDSAFGL